MNEINETRPESQLKQDAWVADMECREKWMPETQAKTIAQTATALKIQLLLFARPIKRESPVRDAVCREIEWDAGESAGWVRA